MIKLHFFIYTPPLQWRITTISRNLFGKLLFLVLKRIFLLPKINWLYTENQTLKLSEITQPKPHTLSSKTF